jgi:biopolymer transport protein ExbD
MDMTPMIDVVFQLIIFFMTVSQQSQLEDFQLELPQAAGVTDQGPTTITVNLTLDDKIIIDGDPYDLAGFDALIARELVAAGGDPDRVQVVMRVDRRADSALANRVMTRLKAAGIVRTRIAVQVPGQG